MQLSLVKTLANKHRMSVNRVYRKYRSTVPTPHGTLTVLAVQHARGQGKTPLVARFGGIELRWQKQAHLNDQPPEVFSTRSEVVQRLLAQVCALCGTMAQCEVHHIRQRADLSRPGRRAKALWVRRMAARRRKTLVVCQRCHADIHRERLSRHKVTA